MNSWDVRRARVQTLKVVVKEIDWLDENQIEALVSAVAEDRYTQQPAKEAFIVEALAAIGEDS